MNEMLRVSEGRSSAIVCPLPVALSGCPAGTTGSVNRSAVPGTGTGSPGETPAVASAAREYAHDLASQLAARTPSSPMQVLSNAASRPPAGA
jgi:hypothetical protein